MKSLTPKEKWFYTFAKEAAFTLSPTAFRKSADKAHKIFLAAEQQGISEKTICGRIGEPEMVVRKADDEERQIWCKPAAVLAAVFLAAYILWVRWSWYYIAYVAHCLTILVGIVAIPHICGFLCGRIYYEMCAVIMRKEAGKGHMFSAVSVIALILFLILDGYIFQYGILRELFGGVILAGCFVIFHLAFFGLIVFLFAGGILKIRRFDRQGYQLVYLGNGLLYSFYALHVCVVGMIEPDLGRSLGGMLIAVLPFAAALVLYRLESTWSKKRYGI